MFELVAENTHLSTLESGASNEIRPVNLGRSTNPRSTLPQRDELGQYLDHTGHYPLLNRQQEWHLGKRITRFRGAFQRLILQERPVLEFLAGWLKVYQAGQVRLDVLFDVALKDTGKRAELEPLIKTNTSALLAWLEHHESHSDLTSQQRLAFWKTAIRLIEPLRIRSRYFSDAPYRNPNAQSLATRRQKLAQRLATANLRLVVSIARKICPDPELQIELIQEGNRGLMHAVEKYDYRRRLRFSTYATPWIRKAMLEVLPNQHRLIRVTDPFRSRQQAYQQTRQKAKEQLPTGSQEQQLADTLGIPFAEACQHWAVHQDVQSLDRPGDHANPNQMLRSLVADHRSPSPLERAVEEERQTVLREHLTALEEREQRVLRCRFGLEDGISRSLAEVGKLLKFSRERVRQLEKSALAKLAERVPITL